MIKTSLAVAIGASFGANLRYLIIHSLSLRTFPFSFPLGVFLCNCIGSFLAGFFLAYGEQKQISVYLIQAVGIGFLGSLTTFSSFAVDNVGLMDKSWLALLINILFNVILTFVAVQLGGMLCKRVLFS